MQMKALLEGKWSESHSSRFTPEERNKMLGLHQLNRYTSVDTGLRAELRSRGLITDRGNRFVLPHNVQASSEAHTASYPMKTGGCFPGIKAALE
jgi:hypothetical protein